MAMTGQDENLANFIFVDGRGNHGKATRSFINRERLRQRSLSYSRSYRSGAPPMGWERQARALSPQETITPTSSDEPLVDLKLGGPETSPASDSLLTTIERGVFNIDPFSSLPMTVDHASQALYYFSTRHWESDSSSNTYTIPALVRTMERSFPYDTPIRLCTTLSATSAHLDLVRGRGVSPQTIYWKVKALQCMNNIISDPATRYSDEALLGILTLLLNDVLTANSQKSYIHSRGLMQVLKHRGSPECQSTNVNYFVSAMFIILSKGSIAYLETIDTTPAGLEEAQAWKVEVDFLVSTLRGFSNWVSQIRQEHRAPQDPLDASCSQLVRNMGKPQDVFESSHQAFVLCYLALLIWEHRGAPQTINERIRDIHTRHQQLGRNGELPNLVWVLIQGVDGNQDRKWQAVRLNRVIHRLSNETRSVVKESLSQVFGIAVGNPQTTKLTPENFLSVVEKEALAGLPCCQSD